MATSELLRASQAAERLNVHPATIRRYVADNRIRAVRLPSGHVRIFAADIEALTQRESTSHPQPVAA